MTRTRLTPLLAALLFASSLVAAPSPSEIAAAVNALEARLASPRIADRTVDLFTLTTLRPDPAGTHDFRSVLQTAIDDLAAAGGGTLRLPHPAGAFTWSKPRVQYRLSGYLELRTGVRLELAPSTVLHFECAPVHYTDDGAGIITRYEGTTLFGHAPLLRAFGLRDVALVAGPGHGAVPEITGDGEAWLAWQNEALPAGESIGIRAANQAGVPLRERRSPHPGGFFRRPVMLQFFLCQRVLVDGVKFSDAPFWMVHPVFSEDVVLRNLLFDGPNVNNDGIDVDSSRRVLIENVMFNNHDDNVALKSGRDREGREGVDITGTLLDDWTGRSPYLDGGRLGGPTEDVIVRNCIFKGHYALAIGSEMSGDVRRVYAVHNRAVQQVANVLFIKSSRQRGGVVEDIVVHDVTATTVRGAAISLIPNYDGDTTSPHLPHFRHITVSDMQVERASRGLAVHGWAEAPITDVTLRDLRIGLRDDDAPDAVGLSGVTQLSLQRVVVGRKAFDTVLTRDALTAPPRQN